MLETADTLNVGSLGAPIYQLYDASTCSFLWQIYVFKNIGTQNVVATFKDDYSSIAISLVTIAKGLFVGSVSLTGTLNRLVYCAFSSAFSSLYSLYYDSTDNLYIAYVYQPTLYQVFKLSNLSTNGFSLTYLISATNGEPFTILNEDISYFWMIGRIIDASSSELAFHHARIRKIDGINDRAFYMDAGISLSQKFNLKYSDLSVPN